MNSEEAPDQNRDAAASANLSGKLGWVRYDVWYVWDIKPRDSNEFISMSKQAGALGGARDCSSQR